MYNVPPKKGMLPPGFEPGSRGREPRMIDRTTLQEHNLETN